jgi:hypothetical protein
MDYSHTKAPLIPEGIAKVKILKVTLRKRRDPEDQETTVETLVLKMAVVHYSGLKEVIEKSLPVTHKQARRIDQFRVALGEVLPADDDSTRYRWDEQSAVGKQLYVWFKIFEVEEGKKRNSMEYLPPSKEAEAMFEECVRKEKEVTQSHA